MYTLLVCRSKCVLGRKTLISVYSYLFRAKMQEFIANNTDFKLNLPELEGDSTIFDFAIDSNGKRIILLTLA